MGADIHVYIENKNENGVWNYVTLYAKNPSTYSYEDVAYKMFTRDYNLFDLLAGNTDNGFPELRGVPEDMSLAVMRKYEEGEDEKTGINDFYNATWFDWIELQLLAEYRGEMSVDTIETFDSLKGEYNYKEIFDNPAKAFVDKIQMILAINGIYTALPGEVRVLIWFDN